MIEISVILPTHRPHPVRLNRTLRGLRAQTLPPVRWETLLVDNASEPALAPAPLADDAPANLRVVRESTLGLSHARRRGLAEACGEFIVLVDDDNVLAPEYLENVLARFATHPRVGALGGPSRPEFDRAPEPWTREFLPLLALRDLGPDARIADLRPPGAARDEYPACAPIGAGMALRRDAARAWFDHSDPAALPDRRGGALTSGGDNDIVLHALRTGWSVGYFPELGLTHLIPAGRLEPTYLARLNFGIQFSWMRVLHRHAVNPWPPLTPLGARLRQARAWFTHRAWRGPAHAIRWHGASGHFAGRVLP